jgi:glutamine amidotransferase
MFMHNGGIGNWRQIKRRLATSLKDQWFMGVQGSTDSEWAFALFLDCMDRMGHSPDQDPGPTGFGHTVLRQALLRTIERINEFIREVSDENQPQSEDSRSLLNFAVTDGHSVVCTRYVSSATDEAASLFFSSGTSWTDQGHGEFNMERRDKGSDIVLVASEPLTFERGKLPIFSST